MNITKPGTIPKVTRQINMHDTASKPIKRAVSASKAFLFFIFIFVS